MALISKLENIGNAIRNKTGKTDKLTLDEMATEIASITTGEGGGADIPEEAFLVSGDCSNRFKYNAWDWFLNMYGDRITTKDITNATSMFSGSNVTKIPFDLNFKSGTNLAVGGLFEYCKNLKEIGKLKNARISSIGYMFFQCSELRYLPEFENVDTSYMRDYGYASMSNVFNSCYSLREVPESFLKELYNSKATSDSYTALKGSFGNCYALDEVRGLNPQTGTMASNMFGATFGYCYRLKDVIFATQDDGTPYSVSWKSQTLDLSQYVGWATNEGYITTHNSGITTDKKVSDDATYQALKDDPDWFTTKIAYSRYNKESALRTIQSLPDTSDYLATQSGATNIIKFAGNAGSSTDGGAINTLTESQIAVATAKGFTVSFV